MSPNLDYLETDLTDPVFRLQLGRLLQDIFDLNLQRLEDLDIWPRDYRTFSYRAGDLLAANVSCFPLPLMVAGEAVLAGAVQSVATRPDFRGQGLFRDLMTRALAYADRRYGCVLLYSKDPALYRRFGFREIDTCRFAGRLAVGAAPVAPVARDLSLDSSDDVALLRNLLARARSPSRHFGTAGREATFILNALWYRAWRLTYLPDHQALVVSVRRDGRLRLLDIVAHDLPGPAPLAAALNLGDEELEVRFTPDRLSGDFTPAAYSDPDGLRLMLRGPLKVAGSPFALPPTCSF